MSQLGELLTESTSGFACGKEDPDGVFQFRMNNVTRTGGLDLSKMRRVPMDAHRNIDRFLVAPGDVLFNATNSPEMVGKSLLIDSLPEPAVFSNHFLRLRPDPSRLLPEYLARWLRWQHGRNVFAAMCRQWVNQATVSRDSLLALSIELPPLEEQRRIAAILDQADALHAKRRQAMELLDELERSTFADIMSSSDDLPEVALGSALESATVFTDGDWVESKDQDPDGEVRLTQLADVGDGSWLDRSARYLTTTKATELGCTYLESGDVLVARMPDPLGRACVFPGDDRLCVTVVDVCVIRPDPARHLPEWLAACLNSPRVRSQIGRLATGTTRSRVSRGNLKKVLIPQAPIELQYEFLKRIERIAALRRSLGAAEHSLSELASSLESSLIGTSPSAPGL